MKRDKKKKTKKKTKCKIRVLYGEPSYTPI